MNFNFKKAFIPCVLSFGIVAFAPFSVFASGEVEEEKKPLKASISEAVKPGYAVVDSDEAIEPSQYERFKFPANKIVLSRAKYLKFNAFSGCKSLTDVFMPFVEEIGWFAFSNCSNLKNVIMPNIKTVCSQAFFNCTSLETIDLRNVEKIADNAFVGCHNLKKIIIPENAAVSCNAFEGCSWGVRILYKNLSLSKEEFFKIFEGETFPYISYEEAERLLIKSEK